MDNNLLNPNSRLRTARIAKGYPNARVFAEQHSIVYTTYISHENGKLPISEKAAKKYAKILNLSSEWLLYGSINNSDPEKNTAEKHLRKRVLEPIILPIVLEAILKTIGRYDNNINYLNLVKQSYIIISEILAKTDDLVEIEAYINSIACLNQESYSRYIIKNEK